MRKLLTLLLILSGGTCFAQVTQHYVEPKGEYKQINTTNDIRIMHVFMDSNVDPDKREKLADSIKQSPNGYIPPDLYGLSYYLFNAQRQTEAMFWYYLAQLRARYDVNRCADKTANADDYNSTFGESINPYAVAHLDTLKQVIEKVINFEKANNEIYDQRWINLSGMGAMLAGLGDKKQAKNKQLSLPEGQWPAIRTKTLEDYQSGFEEAMVQLKNRKN